MCLTLDGKLVLFHNASLAGGKVSPEVDSTEHDEKDAPVKLPVNESSIFSHGLQKKEHELVGSTTNVQSLKSDVLQSFDNVEVQGDKIRNRNSWSKWIQAASGSSGSSVTGFQ
ncbi:hypothetical protein KIW84_071224 [Lathyrus oleraceus]|uniref:Uncharacterized protein n=1 Tax=Pisum sativum TaxID=3888 RepID=A0A9D4ZVP8_PEA|nr:hypothetical protein KIW84_071224 [Pisum sativum]